MYTRYLVKLNKNSYS